MNLALRRAATLILAHADSAADAGERWITDHSPDYGLVVGAYTAGDVDEHGYIMTGCVAYFAYPDDEERRTHKHALGAAAHMSALDPCAALALSEWLTVAAREWGSNAALDKAALDFATRYLRDGEPPVGGAS